MRPSVPLLDLGMQLLGVGLRDSRRATLRQLLVGAAQIRRRIVPLLLRFRDIKLRGASKPGLGLGNLPLPSSPLPPKATLLHRHSFSSGTTFHVAFATGLVHDSHQKLCGAILEAHARWQRPRWKAQDKAGSFCYTSIQFESLVWPGHGSKPTGPADGRFLNELYACCIRGRHTTSHCAE